MISEAFDLFFPFFDDLQVQKCNVKDNASPNCLTSPLSAADTVLSAAHGSSFKEQFDSAAHNTGVTFRWEKGKGYRAAITYAGAKMACPPPAMAAIRGSCLARFPSLRLETGTGGAGGQGDSPDPRIRLQGRDAEGLEAPGTSGSEDTILWLGVGKRERGQHGQTLSEW